jgi:hypothetical protein
VPGPALVAVAVRHEGEHAARVLDAAAALQRRAGRPAVA